MPALGRATFRGKSGKDYQFTVYPLRTKIRKIAGLYVVADRSHEDSSVYRHQALYVGQTEDLSQPFEEHHKAREFERHNANCICFHKEESEDSRIEIERDLIAGMHPICNDY
jgi:hypothetical protein